MTHTRNHRIKRGKMGRMTRKGGVTFLTQGNVTRPDPSLLKRPPPKPESQTPESEKVGFLGKLGKKAQDLKAAAKARALETAEDLSARTRGVAASALNTGRAVGNTLNANTDSEFLIRELNQYFKGEKFQELRKKEAADDVDISELGRTPLDFDFTKSQYYSPQAWDRMIDKLRKFISKDPTISDEEKGRIYGSFDLLKLTKGRGDLPYYDLSYVEETISTMEEQEKARQAAEAARQAAEAERQKNSGYEAASTGVQAASMFFGGGRRNRTKRSKSKRHTRRR